MYWMFERLVNSLHYQVEKAIDETLYENETYKSNRWSLIERLVVWSGNNIFLSLAVIFLTASLISVLIISQYEALKVLIPMRPAGVGVQNLVDLQSTIFNAQVTIVGLIFPLVIAFIGILLQDRSSNEAVWNVYKHSSGFMLVGFSAVMLLVIFIIFRSAQPWLDRSWQAAISMSITYWFAFNLLLSVWFLNVTVRFLSVEHRMQMIVKYVINETIAKDVRRRLLAFMADNAMNSGLLSGSKYGVVELSYSDELSLKYCVHKNFSKEKAVNNVWYAFLNIGIWLWDIQNRNIKFPDGKPVLKLLGNISAQKKKNIIVAATDKSEINMLSRIFLNAGFRASPSIASNGGNVVDMVGALFGQIEDSLSDGNSRLFESAKNSLLKLHKDIELSMAFIDSNGEPNNWLLLRDSIWFGRSFLDEFLIEMVKIGKLASRKIQDDSSYFEMWCYAYPALFKSNQKNIIGKIAEGYIDGHCHLWGVFIEWMSGYDDRNVVVNQVRSRLIKYFIGSWESWSKFNYQSEIENRSAIFSCKLRHMENTSYLVVNAAKYENKEALEMAIDSFIYWGELFLEGRRYNHDYSPFNSVLTLMDVVDGAEGELALSESAKCNDGMVLNAIRNYWFDIRFQTAAYLLKSSRYRANQNYKKYIRSIVKGERIGEDFSSSGSGYVVNSLEDLLVVYFRHSRRISRNQFQYVSILEEHLDRLVKVNEPDWISGRIYSTFGGSTEIYLPALFQVEGIALAEKAISNCSHLLSILLPEGVEQFVVEGLIDRLQSLKIVEEDIIDIVCYQYDLEEDIVIQKRTYFIHFIDLLIAGLRSGIAERVVRADIDGERLISFGVAASEGVFEKEKGDVPLVLFDTIEYVTKGDMSFKSIELPNFNKEEVALGININRAINENKFFNELVRDYLIRHILSSFYAESIWEEYYYDDALMLIASAIEASESIKRTGGIPIMFVGPWDIYNLISNSIGMFVVESYRLPFEVSFESGKPEGYLCHLAGIEVYKVPSEKFCALFSLDVFQKISIFEYEVDRYIEANFSTAGESDLEGTLTFSLGVEFQFKNIPGFKYFLNESNND